MEPDLSKYQGEKQTITSHIIEFFQTLVIFLAIGSVIYLFIAQPHKVSGASMKPNFQDGDYIITDKLSYRLHEPQRGEIIVFKNPRNENQEFIKRIIGTPGDKVKVEEGKVFVNDKPLEETYLPSGVTTPPGPALKEGVDQTVDKDSYIVMGDNRTGSSDSREWGFIKKNEIVGKVFLRYWPQNSIELYPASIEKFKH